MPRFPFAYRRESVILLPLSEKRKFSLSYAGLQTLPELLISTGYTLLAPRRKIANDS